MQVVDALRHMHSMRILHRDIKPANIFLDQDDNVKIGDLGLGRRLGPDVDPGAMCGADPRCRPWRLALSSVPHCTFRQSCARAVRTTKRAISGVSAVSSLSSQHCIPPSRAAPRCRWPSGRTQTAMSWSQTGRRIINEPMQPIPTMYSKELGFLIGKLLEKDCTRRPSAEQVLQSAPVRVRVRSIDAGP